MSGLALVEFLRARLDEDEAEAVEARRWTDRDWTTSLDERGDGWVSADSADPIVVTIGHVDEQARAIVEHIARWGPYRIRREVEAKRRIVEAHSPAPEGYLQHRPGWSICRSCCAARPYRLESVRVPCGTLKLLALPYVDHPDFDQAWRTRD